MNITDIVSRQYTEWSYPKPISNMVEEMRNGYFEYGSPNLFGPLLWPERKDLNGLKVLIAGCGTNQAAYNSLAMPNSIITAIDLSLTSLQHSQFLKEKHNLRNVTLHQMSLLDVKKLGEKFDLILCSGVLHHLDDPDAGLRALRDVLNEDGVMNIMLYGRYFRQGIYMMQEIFQRLECNQSKEDVDFVKETLKIVPESHPIHPYLKMAEDLGYDSGIVDTFLHQQDRAYSVPEVLKFASSNNLAFFDWEDRCNYSVTSTINHDSLIKEKILKLPEVEQWPILELFNNISGTHRFILCHPAREKIFKIKFDEKGWLDFVPVIRSGLKLVKLGDIQKNTPAKLKRNWHEFSANKIGMALLQQVNGRRSIHEIIDISKGLVPEITVENSKPFFKTMHDWGHLMYWLK
jgi:2-polyprenyl-3-methyl-5-hydroxy-6-metoxy-1,4-benzoquinol methylase